MSGEEAVMKKQTRRGTRLQAAAPRLKGSSNVPASSKRLLRKGINPNKRATLSPSQLHSKTFGH
jgi:hypothetical protein